MITRSLLGLLVLLLGCPESNDDDSVILLDDDDVTADDDDATADDDDVTADDDDLADDDDATADDDDSAVATGTCSTAGGPGQIGTVPCQPPPPNTNWTGDVFQISMAQGARLDVTVDTVSMDTTFDPRVRIIDVINTWLAAGDDDCVCAFSAGDKYGCAEAYHVAEFAENVRIEVVGFLEDACADGVTGEYVLRATIDGVTVLPIPVTDDGPTTFEF